MKEHSNWNSENVLFSVLTLAVFAWTAASLAAEKFGPAPAAACMVAHLGSGSAVTAARQPHCAA